MQNKISFLAIVLLLQGFVLFGQSTNGSPYSRFGYGSIEQIGFGKNQAMGGIGIAIRSNENLSPLNPASYSEIDTLSQIFEFGLAGQGTRYTDARNSEYNADMNFSYLGMGFPISKWWGVGIGILPISFVGYDFGLEETDPVDKTSYGYYGDGGISKFFWGNSFEIMDRVSLGVNFNYMFGSMNHYRSVSFPNSTDVINDNSDFTNFGYIEKIRVNAVQFTFGLQAVQPINEKSRFIFGAVYEPKADLNAKRSLSSYRILPVTNGQIPIETIVDETVDMEFPQAFGAGLTYEITHKLQIGADYYYQNFQDAKFYGTDSLQNRQRIGLGVEYIPNAQDNSYFKRIRYRAGANINNSYQKLYGNNVADFGITFGLGLPLGYSKTSFNLAFEYGKIGTTDNNLVQQDYLKVVLNLSLNDVWFLKRKFK